MAITSKLNVQAEYDHRQTDSGDLAQNFGEDDFDPSFDRDFDEKSARLGLRYTPSARSNLLFSAIYSDRDQDTKGLETQSSSSVPVVIPPPPPPPFLPPSIIFVPVTIDTSQRTSTDEISRQFEAQHIYQGESLNLITGLTYANVDQEYEITNNITFTPPGVIGPPGGVIDNTFKVKPDIKDSRGYVYGNFKMPTPVTWTLGMSYHDYDEDDIDFDRFNPKVGLQWAVTDSLQLRAAWFKVVKPALASNRTLEPTQVAGFNQYFDDTNATRSERIGAAVDWKVSQNLYLGTELSRRELKTPEFSFGASTTDWDVDYLNWDEWSHRVYTYWTPAERWSFSAEVVYDKFEGDASTTNNNLPHKVRTYSLPLQLQYFYPNGFFSGFGTTFVKQKVNRTDVATYSEGESDFSVYDASIGYRFPKRRGIASLTVQNLTDREFEYQDDSFREFQDAPSTGPFIPERNVMARFTLSF